MTAAGKHLRRYQLYLEEDDGLRFLGFQEGWDLTGREALRNLVRAYVGPMALVGARYRGNRMTLATDEGPLRFRAVKV